MRNSSFAKSLILVCSKRFKSEKFITTPIYYANSKPHIGHLYTNVLASTYAKYLMMGEEQIRAVKVSSGMDEHGMKVQNAALSNSQSPQHYVDQICLDFKKMYAKFQINNFDFIRTTDASHARTVLKVWNSLLEADQLYMARYSGWYNPVEEAFVGEADLPRVHVLEPQSRAKLTISTDEQSRDSYVELEWRDEPNWMFRLSAFSHQLKRWIESEQRAIWPHSVREAMLELVNRGLKDCSVSRPFERLQWGIQAPPPSSSLSLSSPSSSPLFSSTSNSSSVCSSELQQSQTIYVWFEALLSYLTVVQTNDDDGGGDEERFWPPDIQFVGKDIAKFHCILWPAILMALNLNLPRKIVCHGHWLVDGVKMSKSVGNVVDPMREVRLLGGNAEAFCFALMRLGGGIQHDTQYSRALFKATINAELVNSLGNLISRILASKLNPRRRFVSIPSPWSEQSCVILLDMLQSAAAVSAEAENEAPRNDRTTTAIATTTAAADEKLIAQLTTIESAYKQAMADFEPHKALIAIRDLIQSANASFDAHKPWRHAARNCCVTHKQEEQKEQKRHLQPAEFEFTETELISALIAETLRVAAILLHPFASKLSSEALFQLGCTRNASSSSSSSSLPHSPDIQQQPSFSDICLEPDNPRIPERNLPPANSKHKSFIFLQRIE